MGSCLSDHDVTKVTDPAELRTATGKRGKAYRACRALLPSSTPTSAS